MSTGCVLGSVELVGTQQDRQTRSRCSLEEREISNKLTSEHRASEGAERAGPGAQAATLGLGECSLGWGERSRVEKVGDEGKGTGQGQGRQGGDVVLQSSRCLPEANRDGFAQPSADSSPRLHRRLCRVGLLGGAWGTGCTEFEFLSLPRSPCSLLHCRAFPHYGF